MNKKLNQLERLFTTQWGKLMESLVEGDLIKLLKKRNIMVNQTSTRVEGFYGERQYEFDIIARDGNKIVVVEVKTTLRPEDIKEFIEELKLFKNVMPEYNDKKVIGAVAYLRADGDANRMAENSGFFVIKATGSSADIINKEDFTPVEW